MPDQWTIHSLSHGDRMKAVVFENLHQRAVRLLRFRAPGKNELLVPVNDHVSCAVVCEHTNGRRTVHSIVAVVCLLLFFSCSVLSQKQPGLVNFSHLAHLTEKIEFYGDTVSIVHIYANYPDYRWVDAKESGPEGIACVDDAARAAVVVLRHYELTGDTSSLEKARSLLKFVMGMQTDDGEFYNFILEDHTINRFGKTSFKSFGWWAARGVWSMSTGYRILKNADPRFAGLLKMRIDRSIPHVETLMKHYGEVKIAGGLRVPQWLLYESGADVTSELLLGLTELYRATGEDRIRMLIKKLCDGIMMMQEGSSDTFPYGLHRSWETMWHAWGNSQSFALAYAGKILGDTAMIASAEKEALGFYGRLLIEGMQKEWDCAAPEKKFTYDQIAYGIRPMTLALLRLYDATGNELYQKMAGLAASWLFGNNVLNQVIYDSTTGRCYDGITDSTLVNRNSGAESTIESLYTILEIEQYPCAKKYLSYTKIKDTSATGIHAIEQRPLAKKYQSYKKIKDTSATGTLKGFFRNQSEDVVMLLYDTEAGTVTMNDGRMMR